MPALELLKRYQSGGMTERELHSGLFEIGYSVESIGATQYLKSHKNRVVGALCSIGAEDIPANDIAEARAWFSLDRKGFGS